jgi:Transglycosylase SLT domain/SPOR domain
MDEPLGLPVLGCVAMAVVASAQFAWAGPATDEPVEVSVCRTIEASAKARDLPVAFLTRLIWQESSFRAQVVSPAGAQGIAQFMPGTAGDWKLANPFDPAEAIPKAAELLASLKQRFGNLGIAAAAYNAGAGRVANWLGGRGSLPSETRRYVLNVTERPVEDWASKLAEDPPADSTSGLSCLQLAASIRRAEPNRFAGSALTAPWGVQLSGSFSKPAALAAYERASANFRQLIGDVQPMILAGRAADRGFSPFYRVRVPASSRAEANALCGKILRGGGACAVLRS